jgi:very-short-patch-repair endonuclease
METSGSARLREGVARLSTDTNEKINKPVGDRVELRVVRLAIARAGGAPVPKDRLIGDLASRQYGVVSRKQLLAMGIGAGAIETRLQRHYFHRLHRGVYAVGHLALVPLAREMAAVLACGENAAISHRTAAIVWHLLTADEEGPVDVTVTSCSGRRRPGLRIHQSRRLLPADVRHFRGLPVTAPGRTLIDLAELATDRELERATHEAFTRRLVNAPRLLADIELYRGRRGLTRLRRLLEGADPSTLTRSEAEERFLALVRAAALPPPEVNVRVQGYEVDFLWREAGLVVEVDGFQFHSSRGAFERDRRRDDDLQNSGFRVQRITWRQLVDEPYATVARTTRALQSV